MTTSRMTCTALALTLLCAAPMAPGEDTHADIKHAGFESARLGTRPFTDPELEGYEMTLITLQLAPGGYDARAHRHEADVFGVVLTGAVVIELDGKPIGTFERGEVFSEPFNALHSAIRNASATEPATVMALIPMRKDRKLYVPVE